MKEFKRTYTMFEGREVIVKGREQFIPQQRVKIVRSTGDHDDEDQFVVEFANLGTAVVDGCDLSPHPESPATNVELLTHMCNNGSTAMVQAFIVSAVQNEAERIVQNEADVRATMEGGMIAPDLWINTAKEVLAQIKSRS